jgi:hypothetical protein
MIAGSTFDDLCDITSDLVAEGVFNGFETCARQNTHAARIPLLRRHPIEMDVVRVVEAVPPVLLNLP